MKGLDEPLILLRGELDALARGDIMHDPERDRFANVVQEAAQVAHVRIVRSALR